MFFFEVQMAYGISPPITINTDEFLENWTNDNCNTTDDDFLSRELYPSGGDPN
jgi:hypothetical protein